MSLYASAEGVLYRSYDTFVGNTGFYDGNDDGADMQYTSSSGYPEMSGQVTIRFCQVRIVARIRTLDSTKPISWNWSYPGFKIRLILLCRSINAAILFKTGAGISSHFNRTHSRSFWLSRVKTFIRRVRLFGIISLKETNLMDSFLSQKMCRPSNFPDTVKEKPVG